MSKSSTFDATSPGDALERNRRIFNFRALSMVFWGLIVAKCLLLQWAIIRYDMPVNGLLFVWTPSFIFGALCVAVYMSAHAPDYTGLTGGRRLVGTLRYGLMGVIVVLAVASVGMGAFAPLLLPGMAALLAGVGVLAEGIYAKRRLYLGLGAAWWLGAIALLVNPTPAALGGLALLTLLLIVLPASLDLLSYRLTRAE